MLPLMTVMLAAAPLPPVLDDTTVAVVRIDVRNFAPTVLDREIQRFGIFGGETSFRIDEWPQALTTLRSGGVEELVLVASLADVPAGPLFAIRGMPSDAALKVIEQLTGFAGRDRINGWSLIASPVMLARLKTIHPVAVPEMARAFEHAGPGQVQIALRLPEDLKRTIAELVPKLPHELGGFAMSSLTNGFVAASVSADDIDDNARVVTKLHFRTSHDANMPDDAIKTVLTANAKLNPLAAVRHQRQDASISLRWDSSTLGPVTDALRASNRVRLGRRKSMQNLERLTAAFQNHGDDRNRAVCDLTDMTGKPLLSWRVALLPYLGETELFHAFKLDEPWDSIHNQPLIAKMPAVYRSFAATAAEGKTRFLGPAFADGAFPPHRTGKNALRFPGDFPDGLANTIICVEVLPAHAIEWSRPGDWTPDFNDLYAALVGPNDEGFLAAFARATPEAIRQRPMYLSRKHKPENIKAMLTRTGNETITFNP